MYALRFDAVDLDRVPNPVLHQVHWRVRQDERWVVLGPNGSGKTTMIQLCSGFLHPTRGTVEVLGHTLGRVDVRTLRARLGIVSASVARMIVPSLAAVEVVLAARAGALEPWWQSYEAWEHELAGELLALSGFADIAHRPFGVLSEGERQQVLLARSLMTKPDLLLLDEPCAGLDVAGRERLLSRLSQLAADPSSAPMVLVTHHLEEVPPSFTHALLLRAGAVLAAGPLAEVLTSSTLSECYGMELAVEHDAGRWTCRSVAAPAPPA